MIEYCNLNERFLIRYFPELQDRIVKEMDGFDEFLPHVIIGNVFNPLVVTLLKQDDYVTNELLNRILEMYENLSANGDAETQNLVQVTLLEYLWDEKITFNRALELIGEHTKELWNNIYKYIAVP